MDVVQTKLSNGITVITDCFKAVESVSLQVAVNVGSRNETKVENGISHFIEHMAFKGTKTRTAKQIADEFEEIGGFFNAYTSRDKTVFYCKILKEDIETAIELLSDIIFNSVFAQVEVDRERKVILQELANSLDTPDDIIFDYFQETAFPDQALGRSILGPKENISNFSSDFLKEYFYRFYVAKNMVIAASGNVTAEKLNKLAEKYFKDLKPGKESEVLTGKYVGGEKIIRKELEQSQTIIGYEAIKKDDPNFYLIQIFNNILGDGMSSKLFQEIREQHGLCYSVYSFFSAYNDVGLFSIYTATSAENSQKAKELIEKTIVKTIDEIKQSEIDKAIKSYKANLLMSMENTISRARRIAYSYFNYGHFLTNEEIIANLSEVTADGIKDFMPKIINSKQTYAYYGK